MNPNRETHRLRVLLPDGTPAPQSLDLTMPAGAGDWLAGVLSAFQAQITQAGDTPPAFTLERREGAP